MSKAGEWEIRVSEPHPAWCEIFYRGQRFLHGVHHQDLRDLEYAVARAIKEARDKLPENYKHEMD